MIATRVEEDKLDRYQELSGVERGDVNYKVRRKILKWLEAGGEVGHLLNQYPHLLDKNLKDRSLISTLKDVASRIERAIDGDEAEFV